VQANHVDGRYQAQIFEAVFHKYGAKLRALCTDNASVMRKTWRLMRERLPHIFTYGCAPHAFNLHAKDILNISEFTSIVDDSKMVILYFHDHLQAGGLATLREFQMEHYGKLKALKIPGKTRWNAIIDALKSLLENRHALTLTVNHPDFKRTTDRGRRVRELVLDVEDDSFWDRVQLLIAVLEPIRLSLLILQSDSACMGDVYAQWIGVHRTHSEMVGLDETTRKELLELSQKRMDFLIHPIHFVSYAFHPSFAKDRHVPTVVARKWLHNIADVLKVHARPRNPPYDAFPSLDSPRVHSVPTASWLPPTCGQLDYQPVRYRDPSTGQPTGLTYKQALDKDLNFFFGDFMNDEEYEHAWNDTESTPVSREPATELREHHCLTDFCCFGPSRTCPV